LLEQAAFAVQHRHQPALTLRLQLGRIITVTRLSYAFRRSAKLMEKPSMTPAGFAYDFVGNDSIFLVILSPTFVTVPGLD
jgi:hypothetical protein